MDFHNCVLLVHKNILGFLKRSEEVRSEMVNSGEKNILRKFFSFRKIVPRKITTGATTLRYFSAK